jgi:hypothetical protein
VKPGAASPATGEAFQTQKGRPRGGRPFACRAEDGAADAPLPHLWMSTSFVSLMNSVPMTSVITAMTIGYQRPE